MPPTRDLFHLACEYHRALPNRIRAYLNARGISDEVIDHSFLGWNGSRITIPVFNHKGICAFFRLAKDPEDTSDSPKMLSSRGSTVDLYGWDALRLRPQRVVLCEGEFDRLVLETNGFEAVTSTGGAGTFRKDWADAFADIFELYVCFDRDRAGRKGASRVARLIPHAKIVELPAEVGDGGDVTDFFLRIGKTRGDFEKLLTEAQSAPPQTSLPPRPADVDHGIDATTRARIDRIKREVPIETVVGAYTELRRSGITLVGLCPFHDDHHPSFAVYPHKGNFHCFACSAHGDVIAFLQKAEQLSFPRTLDALERLQSHDEARPE